MNKIDHVTPIAQFLVSHTGGEVKIPPRRTTRGISLNDSMFVDIKYLQEMARFWLSNNSSSTKDFTT